MNIPKTNTNTTLFVLVLLLLNFASIAQAQDKATLAWKLKKADELTLEFEQIQSVQTRIDARDRSLESEMTLAVGWKVIEVADSGDATIEQTIERIRLKTGTPGDEVKKVVDLDTGSEDRLRGVSRDVMKQVKTLIGLKFEVVMSPNGEVVTVTPDASVAPVVAALPKTSALPRVFSAAGMTRLIADSTFNLSDNKVGSGDSWSETSKPTMTANDGRIFNFDKATNYKVKSIDSKQANIDVEITLQQTPAAPAKVATALTSPLELTSFTGGGEIVFDHATGSIVSSEIKSETKTRVTYREDQVKTTIATTNRLTVTRK